MIGDGVFKGELGHEGFPLMDGVNTSGNRPAGASCPLLLCDTQSVTYRENSPQTSP